MINPEEAQLIKISQQYPHSCCNKLVSNISFISFGYKQTPNPNASRGLHQQQ
jgi:hypothetical protein